MPQKVGLFFRHSIYANQDTDLIRIQKTTINILRYSTFLLLEKLSHYYIYSIFFFGISDFMLMVFV